MIDLSFLVGRPVAVLGLGRSGLAAATALVASGVEVWAWDDAATARSAAAAAGVPLVDLGERDLGTASALVLSPGIPHRHPSPHPLVERARNVGCEVMCDIELLGRACPHAHYVGVTGTNGKSTTTALIGHLLTEAGKSCEIGGNIGVPALALRPLDAGGIYVLEVSSYQLELMPSLVFAVAVLLNISADHLGRHGGMDGYVAAKRRIFRGQGAEATAVVGLDDQPSRAIFHGLAEAGGPRRIGVSGHHPVDDGVFAAGGVLYDAIGGGRPRPVLALGEASALRGEHNGQNAAAAYAAASAVSVEGNVAATVMRSFRGLAHRLELISVVDGIAYVNDSKATNPDAAARALACYESVYWIAGGRPKEGGLAALDPYLDRIRHAFLIGEAAPAFAAELAGKVPLTRCGTLENAVREATARAAANGAAKPTVLLSPACASFDQFRDFEDRGDTFRALVRGLGQ
jgi:UDP-N-acetylmuramoylalanine--D-glutamate ligase